MTTITLYRPAFRVLETLAFQLSGTPSPRPRPRCRAVRVGRKWIGQMYHPKGRHPDDPRAESDDIAWWRAHAWHARLIAQAKSTPGFPRTPWLGYVRLSGDFFFERPESMYGRKHPDGPILRPSKPDRDNLDKAVMDALTEARLWKDDGQVCAGGELLKWYAAKGAGPGLIVIGELVAEDTPCLF